MHLTRVFRGGLVVAAIAPVVVALQGSARGQQTATALPPVASSTQAPTNAVATGLAAPADTVAVPAPTATAPAPAPTSSTSAQVASALTWAEGFTLPDAPALTLIGANTSKIQEPGSAPQFGAAIVNSLTPQGGLQSGVALELTGRALGFGADYVSYSTNYWTRFASRVSLSVGTAQDPVVASTILGAVGLRLVFIDGTDPLAAGWAKSWTSGELQAARAACDTTAPILAPGGGLNPAHKACVDQALIDYKAKHPIPTAPWNASGLALAGATSAAFANGALSQASAGNTSVWLTGSVPLTGCLCAQLSAAAQYTYDAMASKSIGAGAVRLRGGSNTLRAGLEADYATANPNDPDNRKGRLLVGVDIKMTTGTWLNVNVGGDYNFSGSPVGLLSLASLKYAFASSPDIPGPQ